MFFKLAIGNVKKSIKDYFVYFLTLSFSICIFYIFNSIESQQAMLDITTAQKQIYRNLGTIIGYVSIFISVILGFLMVYANKFLIKRRKKELGVYLTLGMDKKMVSLVLILETFFIGLISLATGLVVGIFGSQALSVVTAKLFKANLTNFTFIFSESAFMKSLFYFGIIYLIIMFFNTLSVSRCKLIDLLNSSKRNERLHVKKIWVSVLLFIISLICIGIAYYLILENGLLILNEQVFLSIGLGSIGTLLFFLSLAGFLIRIVEMNKKIYFRGLNVFVLRQLNNKINTAFVSMSIICIMLFLTIGGLACGFSVSALANNTIEEITPFSATIQVYETPSGKTITEFLKEAGFPFDEIIKESVELNVYETEVKWGHLIGGLTNIRTDLPIDDVVDDPIQVLGVSDYNKALEMQGKKLVVLKDNEFMISADYNQTKEYLEQFLLQRGKIYLQGKELIARSKKLDPTAFQNTVMHMNVGVLIVPDQYVKGQKVISKLLNVNYIEDNEYYETRFCEAMKKIYTEQEDTYFYSLSRVNVCDQSAGLSAVMTFLTIYIGLVFLMASAAVLALQQLSESADNCERYELLRKLGTEEALIKKALFVQIGIYFLMPLGLAIIHSIVGLKVGLQIVRIFGAMDISKQLILTSAIIIVIYGGYFVATYLSSRNIIRAKK